jgi:hypothetical protein
MAGSNMQETVMPHPDASRVIASETKSSVSPNSVATEPRSSRSNGTMRRASKLLIISIAHRAEAHPTFRR